MTTKLSEFYAQRDTILKDKQDSSLSQVAWDAMEEKLLREDLLPELLRRLAPAVKGIPSPLSIHIDYAPDGRLSASFTRNTLQVSLSDEEPCKEEPVGEETETAAESPVEETTSPTEEDLQDALTTLQSITRKPIQENASRTKLRVTTPEGKEFFYNTVWFTLRDVILYAGIGRVQALDLMVDSFTPIAFAIDFCVLPLTIST